MRSFRTWILIVCVSGAAARAGAEPFSFRKSTNLGRPPRPAAIVVRTADDGVVLEVERVRSVLPISDPQRAEVEAVVLSGGASVAVVRVVAAESREVAALVGRNAAGKVEILWAGPLDLRGDPGERSGFAIDVHQPTASEQSGVVVSELRERIHICGQNRTAISPRALDARSLSLRPTELDRLPPQQGQAEELGLSGESPGPTGAPLFPSLQLLAVSSRAGETTEAAASTTTGALTDGDPATFWSEGNPGGARGEFATFRRDGGEFPLRALAFVPWPAGVSKDASISIPRSLWLIGEDGARLKLRFPEAPEPGRRYWAVLAKPLASRCLSFVFDESTPVRRDQPGPTVLAEVEGYTDLDFGPGIERLVEDLGVGGAKGAEAARLLSSAGTGATPKIGAAWPNFSADARRRALRVLAAHAEADEPARRILLAAMDDADADVRKAAFEVLLAGAKGRLLLLDRIPVRGEQGDAVALALARRAPRESIAALLAAISVKAGSERAALREAVALACQGGGSSVLEAVRAWSLQDTDDLSARAAVALALARIQSVEPLRQLATELVAADFQRATTFEDRWRLVQAARTLPAAPAVDAWLGSLAKQEERWMLRAGAIEALAERGAPQATDVALAALATDRYPRVRVAAAKAVAPESSALAVLSVHALKDSWPMVRAAAVERMSGAKGAEAVLQKAVRDRAHQVRAAAIGALARGGTRAAWPLVEERLTDKDEFPEVVAEAIQFASALCVEQAGPALLGLMRQGIAPDAETADADAAMLAFEALTRLGGASAASGLSLAKAAGTPEAFRTAARLESRRPPACHVAR